MQFPHILSCEGQFGLLLLNVSNLDKLTTSLTHWGRMTHICVGKLIIIGSENGLSPDRRQAIIWTNADYCQLDPCEHISVKI